jgi:O-antigen/teichoic acid export membrane protein
VVQNITSLVMLPIYTRFLTPSDYGIIEILNMILDVTLIVFGLRVDQGLFRYYYDEEDPQRRKAIVSTVLFLTLGLNFIGAVFLVAFSPLLASSFLGDSGMWTYLAVYSLCLLAPALVGVPYSYTRLIARPGLFLTLSITKLAVQVGLNVLFVVGLKLKARGVILSTISTQLLLGSVFTFVLLRNVGWRFERSVCKRLFSFSLPLVLSGVASFYVVFGDRFFLRRSWGLAAVGLYGLAYRFGFSFWGLTYGPFQRAWDGQKYEIHKQPDAKATFQLVFSLISKGLLLGALCVSLFIKDFLHIFVGPEYQSAAALVPLIMAAYVVRPLTDFCGFGNLIKERTGHVARASWLSAGVMTAGYLFLIPTFGAIGAATTTLAGFSTELFWIHRTASKYYDMELPWGRFGLAALIAVAAFLSSVPLESGTFTSLATRAAILLGAALVIFISPATSERERNLVRRFSGIASRRLRGALRAG